MIRKGTLEILLNEDKAGRLVVHLRQSSAEECAELALRNLLHLNGVKDEGTAADIIEKIATIGGGFMYLEDSGIPQALRDCIPTIDAVVKIADEISRVRARILQILS